MHTTTGRWKLGLALALTAAFTWAVLPIALKVVLGPMDAVTITWYRFAVAALVLGIALTLRGQLPRLRTLDGRGRLLMAIAIGGLCGNYLLYLVGLAYLSPGTAQVVIQLAPIFLLLGGVFIFRERFSLTQWLGLAVLISGLALFFNQRLAEMVAGAGGAERQGVLLVVASGVLWACYALAQKQLLRVMSSEGILFGIYVAAVAVFFPAAAPGQVLGQSALVLGMLAFACANTLVAYGAFAEALQHWEASRVSAVLAITPLLTLGAMAVSDTVAPGLAGPEPIDVWRLGGAGLVVAGSALTALGAHRS